MAEYNCCRGQDGLSFSIQFRQTPIQVTLTHDRPTLAPHAEGGSRSVRAAGRDDVRKLSVGDRTVFELSRNLATTAPSRPLHPFALD